MCLSYCSQVLNRQRWRPFSYPFTVAQVSLPISAVERDEAVTGGENTFPRTSHFFGFLVDNPAVRTEKCSQARVSTCSRQYHRIIAARDT